MEDVGKPKSIFTSCVTYLLTILTSIVLILVQRPELMDEIDSFCIILDVVDRFIIIDLLAFFDNTGEDGRYLKSIIKLLLSLFRVTAFPNQTRSFARKLGMCLFAKLTI